MLAALIYVMEQGTAALHTEAPPLAAPQCACNGDRAFITLLHPQQPCGPSPAAHSRLHRSSGSGATGEAAFPLRLHGKPPVEIVN